MDRRNNFDLIRLAAALQVAAVHALMHLELGSEAAFGILYAFPGVPVFFLVSGFLVSASLQRAPSLRAYARNRALRLYPALWVATALAVGSVALTGYLATAPVDWPVFVGWLAGQATVLQVFNPDFMRGYGVGVLNGSLWTISVELQFYVLLPLAAALASRSRTATALLLAVSVAAAALWSLVIDPRHGATLAGKLLHVSFVPWFWMFLLGMLAQRHWASLRRLFEGRVRLWLALYAAALLVAVLLKDPLGLALHTNKSSVLLFWPLAGLVLSAAFTVPGLADRLLRGNDISYGLYIYHMPVLNLWLHCGLPRTYGAALSILGLSLLLALASWRFVERPVLRRRSPAPAPRTIVARVPSA